MSLKYIWAFLIFVLIFSSGEATYAAGLGDYKAVCTDIGFTPKTEKFGECVLKLRDRDKAKSAVTRQNQIINNEQTALERERQRLQSERVAIQNARKESEARRQRQRESQFLQNLGIAILQQNQPKPRDKLDDIGDSLDDIKDCLNYGYSC